MSADNLCINDVSLRDGIQSESTIIPMTTRLEIVEALIQSGIRKIQLASFVNAQRVPQMLGIEDFIRRLPNKEGVLYSGLVLNERGLQRLLDTPLQQVDLSLSCSDTHSRKNTGLSRIEAQRQVRDMITSAKKTGLIIRAGLQCVFGCNYEGEISVAVVLGMVRELIEAGCDAISLADSTGQALPEQIKQVVAGVREITDRPIILHLHDTYGLGIANFIAGYEAGVREFDASLGGVGGCPFIPGATGNIALEDMVHLCDRLGIPTGIDLQQIIQATKILEAALDYPLPGKIHRMLGHIRKREAILGTDSLAKNP